VRKKDLGLPWRVRTNWACPGPLKGAFIYDANGRKLAEVSARQVGSQEMCEAIASLMAQAPLLLDFIWKVGQRPERLIEVWACRNCPEFVPPNWCREHKDLVPDPDGVPEFCGLTVYPSVDLSGGADEPGR